MDSLRGGTMTRMGVVVELRRDEATVVTRLPDPSGGTFDAAGDFDRHLGTANGPAFSSIDLYGTTRFFPSDMPALLVEIEAAITTAHGSALRGLLRLRHMARLCENDPRLHLCVEGD